MAPPIDVSPSETAPPSDAATTNAVVVLAAGEGRRMASNRAKVLHEIGGRSMLAHVLDAASAVSPNALVVVVGAGGEAVGRAASAIADAEAVVQEPRLGTGHAVAQTRAALEGVSGDVFVLYGDTPLIRPETLLAMAEERRRGADVVVLGFEAQTPGAYGRLILGPDGGLDRIVEARDANASERAVSLCNSGVMCIDGARLFGWIDRIGSDNAAGEIYLTDLVAIARADGAACAVVRAPEDEVLGVNSRAELARAEAAFQRRARNAAMAGGATLIAPETVFFAYDTRLGRDVVVGPNVVFGPGASVGDDVEIRAFCHIEGAEIASGAQIGPFARLRPGARVGEKARVGNFVEVKNADLAAGSKINHLSYVGDATVGVDANLGAGTITCNYDGYAKHRTVIGDGAFIGSNAALVAPVSVGDGAIVGAGSTITADVPANALAIGRGRQTTKPGQAETLRKLLAATAAARKAAP